MTVETPTEKSSSFSPDGYWCRDHAGKYYDYASAMELIRSFHGYPAPGLVLGVKMVSHAMDLLPENILFDAICETASCLPDAVQVLTLCTVGNGWLKIVDQGKFAVTLYDKVSGAGVRVFLDPEKLRAFSEYYGWFYKLKPKKEQDGDLLYREIQTAGAAVLTTMHVQVLPEHLVKRGKGRIMTCPRCGEAFPAKDGVICKGCQGDAPWRTASASSREPAETEPLIRVVPLKQAAGKRVLHDMTRIVPGREKGPAFKRGQTLTAGDLCRLQQMGRLSLYVEDEGNREGGWVHENEAAAAFAGAMSGAGVAFSNAPSEGKITLTAARDGLLEVDALRLEAFNRIDGVMCAARKRHTVVAAGEELAGTRAIPLFLEKSAFTRAMAVLAQGPLFSVLSLRRAKVGILVTGTEVFRGDIEDAFVPIIQSKITRYGCETTATAIVPDDRKAIRDAVNQMIRRGVNLLVTTAGLSVDPDDVTRKGLADAGCTDMVYGAPILPGAMTLLGRIGEVQVIGVPACGLYYPTTSFDLLLPRLLAGQSLSREDLAAYGHGGFCLGCKTCTFPKCAFGK